MLEVKKIDAAEGFCENVRSIACRVDAKDLGITILDVLMDFVELNANMFDTRVPNLVLCQSQGSVVVAVYGGRSARVDVQT